MGLASRSERLKLAVRPEPYWEQLTHGVWLGYRAGSKTWVLRTRTTGKYIKQTIGPADDHGIGLSHKQAISAAVEMAKSAQCKRVTVDKAMKDYMSYLDSHKKSAQNCKYLYNANLKDRFGSRYVDELSAKDIRAWSESTIAGLTGEPLRKRKQLTNKILTYLKAALNQAWRNGYDCDPRAWQSVQRFPGATKARIRHLEDHEIKKLMGVENTPTRVKDIVLAGLLTGARFSELVALKVSHFDGQRIFIEQSKTLKSRWVPLTAEGRDLFSRLAASASGPEDHLLGNPYGKGGPRKALTSWAIAAGVERFTFHELRHTYATRLLNGGASPFVVAKLLGHADTTMVDRHYGHLYAHTAADAVDRFLGTIEP